MHAQCQKNGSTSILKYFPDYSWTWNQRNDMQWFVWAAKFLTSKGSDVKTRKNEKLTVMKLQPQNKTNDPLLNWSSDHASCQVHAKSKDTHLASMSCKTLPYMLVTHWSPAKGNSQLSKFQTSSMHMLRSSPTTFVIDPKCLIYDHHHRHHPSATCFADGVLVLHLGDLYEKQQPRLSLLQVLLNRELEPQPPVLPGSL